MPFTGTFDILGFTDVLKLLGGKQLTGRLHVRSRAIGANLYLEEGLLVGADVGDHLTTSPTDARSRMEEICFELLEAERGTFEFLPDTPIAAQYPVSMEIDVVLTQARKRLEEWKEIQAVIPSLDLHPRIVSDLGQEEVTLTRERWRLMTAIDGRRTVRAIGRTVGMSDYEVCKTIKSLVDEGMVAVDPPQRAVVNPRRTPTVFVDESAEQAEAELEAAANHTGISNGHPVVLPTPQILPVPSVVPPISAGPTPPASPAAPAPAAAGGVPAALAPRAPAETAAKPAEPTAEAAAPPAAPTPPAKPAEPNAQAAAPPAAPATPTPANPAATPPAAASPLPAPQITPAAATNGEAAAAGQPAAHTNGGGPTTPSARRENRRARRRSKSTRPADPAG